MPFWTCSKTASDEIPRSVPARSVLLQRYAAGILPAAARPQSLFRGLSPLSCGGNAAFGGDPRARYPPLPRPYGSRSAAAGCLTGRPACRRTFRRGGGSAGRPLVRTTALATDWGRVARIAAAALYLLTAAVSLAILAVRILGIRRLRRRSRITDCGAYAVAENPRVGTPFSFLRTVFLGEGYEGRRREIVVCHEASPCAPPPLRRTHRARTGAQPLLVQSLCLDRRALAFGGAGVGGRPRRARCGVRPHGIQDDHFPSTLRL